MTEPAFTTAVVGLGLMGGSMALALSKYVPDARVIGVDVDPATRALAQTHGIETSGEISFVHPADVIILATPVRVSLALLPTVGGLAKAGAVILDLCSTKREIVQAMEALPERVQVVGGHPMCGKESFGFAAADADLYQQAVFVLTPLARTSPNTLSRARGLVEAVGAHAVVMDPDRHDRLVAAVSHMPFVVAAALVNVVEEISQSDADVFTLASSGFRDTTRLAASDNRVMLDTLLTNRDHVVQMLRMLSGHIDTLANALDAGDEQSLAKAIQAASITRRELFK